MGNELHDLENLILELSALPEKDVERSNLFKNKAISFVRVILNSPDSYVAMIKQVSFTDFGMVIRAESDYQLDAWKKGKNKLNEIFLSLKQELEFSIKYPKPLEYTEQVTISWFFKNVPASTIWGIVASLVISASSIYWLGSNHKENLSYLKSLLSSKEISKTKKNEIESKT